MYTVYAVEPDPKFGSGETLSCINSPETLSARCFWSQGGRVVYQDCQINTDTGDFEDCGPVNEMLREVPPTPTFGGGGPFGSDVLSPPGDVSDDDVIPEQPPLFGRNVGNAPLGFFGQQPAAPTTPTPTPPPPTGGEDTQSRIIGPSPTGGCATYNRLQCIPCDLGLAGAACTPASEWPPVLSTDNGIPQAQLPSEEEDEEEEQPPGALPRPPVEEIAPEAEQPEDEESDGDVGQDTAGPLT